MPFDAISTRPFMRHGTADLAAMVDGGPCDLPAILAELGHRERKAARALADRIRAMLPQAVVVQAGAEVPPAFEIVPCVHGDLAPEAREVVVSVERVGATDAPPAKPARKPAAAKRPGDVGWRPPSLEVAIKRAGNPATMWGVGWAADTGAIRLCRLAGMLRDGWRHIGQQNGRDVLRDPNGHVAEVGQFGMIYRPDGSQYDRVRRDAYTDAGRAHLDPIADARGDVVLAWHNASQNDRPKLLAKLDKMPSPAGEVDRLIKAARAS